MNTKQAEAFLPIIKAYSEGKVIQIRNNDGVWHDWNSGDMSFDGAPETYRVKPSPSFRPWKAAEVPVGAVMRPIVCKKGDNPGVEVIVATFNGYVVIGEGTRVLFQDALELYEWNWAGDPTNWAKCGIINERCRIN